MRKTYLDNEVFVELVTELADSITVVRFGEGAYKHLANLDFKYTDEAQDYFNEMYDEYQGLLESLNIVSSHIKTTNKGD